jgi:UDP-N-acetylmuramate--alanine ligase
MHIYFSGIGGAGIGPLAQVALQAGYQVSGSDKQDSQYIAYLRNFGITDVHIGQDTAQIAAVHAANPIDWYVYSSAVTMEQTDAPELQFCRDNGIKVSKRDELLNQILKDKDQAMVAIAGTHGKTTTVAMTVWLFKQAGFPISYSLPAKVSFGDMGHFEPSSKHFVYEADEFDRNFLAFKPAVSAITGVTWDHHEIFPTRQEYQQAFRDFIGQSTQTILWDEDNQYLKLEAGDSRQVLPADAPELRELTLAGEFNRRDAWLAIQLVHQVAGTDVQELIGYANQFPGLQRRMEQLIPGLYTDYAHTPEKVRGGMSVALETAQAANKDLVVIYEPLTNRRQHYQIDEYQDAFQGVKQLYWVPSYLAREDPSQKVLEPAELITHLADPSVAVAAKRDDALKTAIQAHLEAGDMVVGMAGGGGGSLDDWLRTEFVA